jgi:nucleosome binding factor SPN SPT16 subunit
MGWAETLSKILVTGFGPEAINGFIEGYLERITVTKCQKCIMQNKNLLAMLSEKQVKLIRETAKAGNITVSYEQVVGQLSKNRPDVLGIIATTPGGVAWLQAQVQEAKKMLAG